MRYLFVVAVLLAGCMSPEQRAERERDARNYALAQQHYLQSPAGQADANCRTKVQFAMGGYRDPSFTGLEGMARANQLHAECMAYWRRTGQMP